MLALDTFTVGEILDTVTPWYLTGLHSCYLFHKSTIVLLWEYIGALIHVQSLLHTTVITLDSYVFYDRNNISVAAQVLVMVQVPPKCTRLISFMKNGIFNNAINAPAIYGFFKNGLTVNAWEVTTSKVVSLYRHGTHMTLCVYHDTVWASILVNT